MSDNVNSLQSLVTRGNKKVRVPIASLITEDLLRSSAISKLNKPIISGRRTFDKNQKDSTLPLTDIQKISEINKSRVRDLENMVKLFPDLEMVIQIFVSLIQAPKDMNTTTLIYKVDNDFFPPAVATTLIESVKKTIEGHHKIPEGNNQLLREAIFETGSYVSIILPESVIDHVINSGREVTKESIKEVTSDGKTLKGLGFLGPASGEKKIGMESFYSRSSEETLESEIIDPDVGGIGVFVSDNFNALKFPALLEHNRKLAIEKAVLNAGTRSRVLKKLREVSAENAAISYKKSSVGGKLSDSELEQILYKKGDNNMTLFQEIPSPDITGRRSVGRALRMKIPSEAVVPVHLPGKEEVHLGAFIVIDEEGNAISAATEGGRSAQTLSQFYSQDVTTNSTQNNSLGGNLLARARKNIQGNEQQPLLTEVTQIYSSIFEKELLHRLRTGIYGGSAEIGDVEEVSRIMLARALSNRQTRVIFVPSELMTYYAFKFHPNGVGKSALDDMRILAGMRAAALYTRLVATAKNAIGLTRVNITLDEDDQNAEKTVERVRHEILRMNQQFIPVGYTNHEDISDWLSRTGTMVVPKNHPDLPAMEFDFESVANQHEIPDGEMDEDLRRMMYMGFGIAPEIVDQGFSGDFVATAIMNNALLNKRVLTYQDRFSYLLTDECRKLIKYDAIAMNEITAILKDNKAAILEILEDSIKAEFTGKDDELFNLLAKEFVDSLQIKLPTPDSRTLESQKEAFDKFVECIDSTIEFWISNDCVPAEFIGDANGSVDMILASYKAYLIRNWMADNNFLPEMAEIATKDKDGKPSMMLIDMMTTHAQSVAASILESSKESMQFIAAANKDLENIQNPPEDPGSAEVTSEETSEQQPSPQESDAGQPQAGALESITTSEIQEGATPTPSAPGETTSSSFGF